MAEVSQSQVKLFSDSVEISLGYEPTPGKLVLGVIQGRGVSQGRRDILRLFKFWGQLKVAHFSLSFQLLTISWLSSRSRQSWRTAPPPLPLPTGISRRRVSEYGDEMRTYKSNKIVAWQEVWKIVRRMQEIRNLEHDSRFSKCPHPEFNVLYLFPALLYAKVTLYDGHRVIKAKKTRPLVSRKGLHKARPPAAVTYAQYQERGRI